MRDNTYTEHFYIFGGVIHGQFTGNSYYGPKFGSDLVIHVDAVWKSSTEARLGSHYSVPASLADILSKILARPERLVKKQWYFSPDEVEVFYLDPSP